MDLKYARNYHDESTRKFTALKPGFKGTGGKLPSLESFEREFQHRENSAL
jgi:hypothetical protein